MKSPLVILIELENARKATFRVHEKVIYIHFWGVPKVDIVLNYEIGQFSLIEVDSHESICRQDMTKSYYIPQP